MAKKEEEEIQPSNPEDLKNFVDETVRLRLSEDDLKKLEEALLNPKKPNEIAEAVYELTSDKELKNDIINKGYENIKRFSWEKCATEMSRKPTKKPVGAHTHAATTRPASAK